MRFLSFLDYELIKTDHAGQPIPIRYFHEITDAWTLNSCEYKRVNISYRTSSDNTIVGLLHVVYH